MIEWYDLHEKEFHIKPEENVGKTCLITEISNIVLFTDDDVATPMEMMFSLFFCNIMRYTNPSCGMLCHTHYRINESVVLDLIRSQDVGSALDVLTTNTLMAILL